jgi:hypothetical protein
MELRNHLGSAFPERIGLVRSAVDATGVANAEGFVLLDGGEYQGELSLLDEFRDFAFYWNPTKPKDRVPRHVADLMNDPQCSNLIWLSRKALREEDIHLVWIVAHEARHLCQAMQSISGAGVRKHIQRLRRGPQFMTLPGSTLAPLEVDSDIFALQVARQMFGYPSVQAFFARRNLPRCLDPRYLRFLEQLEGSMQDTSQC